MSRVEFEDSLKNPVHFWNEKSSDEVGNALGNAVKNMVAFDQRNPHHCYDLFNILFTPLMKLRTLRPYYYE